MKVRPTETSGKQSDSGRGIARWASIRQPEKLFGTAVILAGAAVATAPLRLHNFSCGHDFDFHLVSWIDALHSWRHGILDPQWTPSPNYGAGEPRFVFYPPLTWMLGAVLGSFFNWAHTPLVLTFLLLAGTGLATRALARPVMSEGPATLAGCFALFSGYTLFSVYERSAYAELSGGFWIPLLLLLILREGQRDRHAGGSRLQRVAGGSALPLALVIAGAWLSNAPVGVMASYLLAAVTVVVAVLSRSWIPVVRAVVGEALGLGLAAFYLVPAAWEQRWVAIRQATDDPGLLIENSFLFGRHPHPAFELHDIELWKVSAVAVSMITVAFLAIFISWRRKRLPGDRCWWIPLALIPLAVLLLQLPFSVVVWNALPKLRFLQFPWRWLVVLEAPMGIFVANAVWMRPRMGRLIVIASSACLFIASSGFAGYAFYQNCAPEDSVVGMLTALRAGEGSEGTDEYAPRGADNSLIPTDLPAACLVLNPTTPLGGGDPDLTPQWTPEQGSCVKAFPFDPSTSRDDVQHKRLHAVVTRAGFLVLRLRDYPAWSVRVNGTPAPKRPVREDGLIVVPVPEGPVVVSMDWTTTTDVLTGRRISLFIALLVIALGLLVKYRAQPGLK